MGDFFKKYNGILLFMFFYLCICFVMRAKDTSFPYLMLSWNVFLAVLPIFFVKVAEMAMEQKKVGWSVFWAILWLLFFPNSLYLVTDFIHISHDTFLSSTDVGRYRTEILVWAKLLVIGLGFFFALLVGLESFYIFEQNLRRKFSKMICYVGVLVVALLTGVGVYIGRFLRFNSWDVLFNPIQLLKQVAEIDGFAVQFIVAFTIFVMGSYMSYRIFRKNN